MLSAFFSNGGFEKLLCLLRVIRSYICFLFDNTLIELLHLLFSVFFSRLKSSTNFSEVNNPDSKERRDGTSVFHGFEWRAPIRLLTAFSYFAIRAGEHSMCWYWRFFMFATSLSDSFIFVMLFTTLVLTWSAASLLVMPIQPPYIFEPLSMVISIHWSWGSAE